VQNYQVCILDRFLAIGKHTEGKEFIKNSRSKTFTISFSKEENS
jgi:hypothetical protein